MKIIINCNWAEKRCTEFENHIYTTNQEVENPDYVVDFYPILFSPRASREPVHKRAIAFGEPSPHFDYEHGFAEQLASFYGGGLLTWHNRLKRFPQYKPYVFGTSWVTERPVSYVKKFGISAIFSNKSNLGFEGYSIRRQIEAQEQRYTVPTMVYNPKGSWLGQNIGYPQGSKMPTFDYMFQWAIESCQEDNYFTEKLLDCFIMKTVPIYWGDPQITSRFMPEGIIIFDKNNFIEQANSLTPEDYEKRILAIEENRKKAFKYIDIFENVLLSLLGRDL